MYNHCQYFGGLSIPVNLISLMQMSIVVKRIALPYFVKHVAPIVVMSPWNTLNSYGPECQYLKLAKRSQRALIVFLEKFLFCSPYGHSF